MAFAFASGDYIGVGGVAGNASTIFALAFWFRTTQAGSTIGLSSKHDPFISSGNGFTGVVNGVANKAGIAAKNAGGFVWSVNSSITVNDGAWHHYGVNFDLTTTANTNELFVDGVSQGTATASAVWTQTNVPLRFGGVHDSFWGRFVGDQAEGAAWSRRLTSAEMASLGKGFRPNRIARDALICYVPMVRSIVEAKGENIASISFGTSATTHPRIIG